MSFFKQVSLLTFCGYLTVGALSVSGCGKKAPLYHPDVDKGNAQSDQAFVFPPERQKPQKPATTSTQPTPQP
ncbi:lipoprotein [Thiosulfativibrio zosterae]|uniref:Lipoprotein n=1 Tax=Thiosulfativibrio zosterae TaxID=2675053 RepID=A0A6F8PKJ9_9GAMM|nr:lipoprotein [Thiosulfativibrio zosterae]BBP42606.1 hypothetical protein THMIRHAT_03520 [Thiosulfativibrio zosterae]